MRIKINQTINQGSVLLVTLCTAWVIGIALVSYLTLVANQSRTTFHSQSWTGCIPVLEAGIEEALTQLNFNNAEGVNHAEAHGWTLMTNGSYFKSEIVGPSADGCYYEVTIDPNTNGTPATPIITSKGYVPAPGNTGTPMGGETAFGMILGTFNPSTPALISRTVVVGTQLQSSQGPPGGLIAKGLITMSTLGVVSVDSFDSSDTNSFPNGQYVAANRKAGAKVLTNLGATPSITVGTAHVYGSVTTGPGGTATTSGSGAVGDKDWNLSNTGIQPDFKTSDANVQFDPVTAPFPYGSGSVPVLGPSPGGNGTNYTYVLDAAVNPIFNSGTITLNSTHSLAVTGGDVTLYVNGNFVVNGGLTPAFVYIAPGASLKLYVTGTTGVAGGGIVNGTGYARNLSIYGLSTAAQTWPFSGSSAFMGTVYAPYATVNFSGSAGAYGSFSANRINLSGGVHVHYDESLNAGAGAQYLASSWNEI